MQNFRTRTVYLNERQCVVARRIPERRHTVDRFDSEWTYRVVDVRLGDGTRYEGLLLLGDDMLLVPEDRPAFDHRDIAEIRSTPDDRIPDFRITEPDTLHEPGGRAIEHGNMRRVWLFGPPEPEPDWRAMSADEAHEHALEDDDRVLTLGGEIPACFHGPTLEALVAGGVRIRFVRAADEASETRVLRPRGAPLWRELLRQEVAIEPGFTVGELLDLLDLPGAVDREVYLRTMPWDDLSFRHWVEAGREPDPMLTEIELVEVGAIANYQDDEHAYTFFFDAVGRGKVADRDDAQHGLVAGERPAIGLQEGPAALRHVPIAYVPDLVLPVSHKETMSFLRGPLLDWRDGGEAGPRPEMPVAFRTRRPITFGQLIRAVLTELPSDNWPPGPRPDGFAQRSEL
ncbi:MAG TPA: hypothetical protein VMM79_00885 [Longimicrobiales bacterium]|nr:hypothetical protein [Longimicrobiales bacterium]